MRATVQRTTGRNADSHRQARHDLSLPAAGGVRRASHDAAAARRSRPDGAANPSSRSRPSQARSPGRAMPSAITSRPPCFADRAAELRVESRVSIDHAPADSAPTTSRTMRKPVRSNTRRMNAPSLRATSRSRRSRPKSPAGPQGFLRAGRNGGYARAAGRHDADHQAHVPAWRAAPEGHAGPGADPAARERKLPRSRGADDRRRCARSASRRGSCPAISMSRMRATKASPAATPMPGSRPTCPVPAGSISIRRAVRSAAGNLVRVAVVHAPDEAIPLQGSWIGFASDHLAMNVAVKVAASDGTLMPQVA